jgi:Uncharacterised nucleotidyltransferase
MMADSKAKQAILRALASVPDYSALSELPQVDHKDGQQLLRWLDQSGLALSFMKKVSCSNSAVILSNKWQDTLTERRERNKVRLDDMLEEFGHLNEAFRSRGIQAVTLKGFSLAPDFFEDPRDRHQTDFDFLVDPRDIPAVAEVLYSRRYSTSRLSSSEESCFTTRLHHIPSLKDDLYSIQHHRQVDLHVSLTEHSPWLTLEVPRDSLLHAVPMKLGGIEFTALSLADRFVCQVFHAFRHSFRSWLRLSWLLEIGRFMEVHRDDDSIWFQIIERAGERLHTKRAFTFILALTRHLFQFPIPRQISSWAADGMTVPMQVWLDHFSLNWAISDWPGNLTNLFLAAEFIQDRNLRKQYLVSRLLPKRTQLSIGTLGAEEKSKSFFWNSQRWLYVTHRSRVHCRDLLHLPLDGFRWKHALGAALQGQHGFGS